MNQPANTPPTRNAAMPVETNPAMGQRAGRSVKRFCFETDISTAYFYELKKKGLIDTAKVFGKAIVLTDPREFLERFREAPPAPEPHGEVAP